MSVISKLLYLCKTSAPTVVHINYLKTYAQRYKLKKFDVVKGEFIQCLDKLKLSNDWFADTLSNWLIVFEEYDLYSKNIKALEVGSWEGLSSYFILKTLPSAHLTCVDTWEGGDEHKGQEVLNKIENNFESNLLPFKSRLSKFKGTSFHYFNSQNDRGQYDLIYIDGSHHCDDVIVDAIKGFELLKVGGIMIFDDYFWKAYKRIADNPAAAINAFLKLKKGAYKIVRVYSQIIIEKVSDRY